jgi:hypothetical protein
MRSTDSSFIFSRNTSRLSPKNSLFAGALATTEPPSPYGSPLSGLSINHGSLPPIAVQSWLSVRKLSVIWIVPDLRDWSLLKTASGPLRNRTGLKGPAPPFRTWHGLCRQIGTGGLRCPDLTQRRQALFGFGGAVRLVACFENASGLIRPVPRRRYWPLSIPALS